MNPPTDGPPPISRATIYVYLPDEAVDVWRPVEAEPVSPGVYRITSPDPDPEVEVWQFRSGDLVSCELRRHDDGEHIVAVAKVSASSSAASPAKQIKVETEAVRRIMNEWNPIGFECPPDEYDCLVDQIVSALHRGATEAGLGEFITSEFADHFGVPVAASEVSRTAKQIVTWWKGRR
jgi:hypothetical protein